MKIKNTAAVVMLMLCIVPNAWAEGAYIQLAAAPRIASTPNRTNTVLDTEEDWGDGNISTLEDYIGTKEEKDRHDELYEQSIMLAEDTLQFEWKRLVMHVIALVKENVDIDAMVVPYMKLFFPKVWITYHQDEFEYSAQKKIYKEKLQEFMDDFNPDVKYGVFSGYQFGKYNFEESKFDFRPFGHNSYLATMEGNNYGFPSTVRTFFLNYDKINGIEIEKERARRFIARRRNAEGLIDRRVWGYLTFRIESVYQGDVSGDVVRVIAKIRSLTLYNDSQREEILAIYTFD